MDIDLELKEAVAHKFVSVEAAFNFYQLTFSDAQKRAIVDFIVELNFVLPSDWKFVNLRKALGYEDRYPFFCELTTDSDESFEGDTNQVWNEMTDLCKDNFYGELDKQQNV